MESLAPEASVGRQEAREKQETMEAAAGEAWEHFAAETENVLEALRALRECVWSGSQTAVPVTISQPTFEFIIQQEYHRRLARGMQSLSKDSQGGQT
jgi:hypothetical protein